MYEELIRRLREEPLDSNKAALPIMDLCIDAATAIENLSHRLDMAQGERDAVTRHMIELEQEVCRLKSRLAAYEDTGLEPEEIRWLGDLRTMKREIIFGVTAERLKELAEADKAGGLVVLPCKVGDHVWIDGRDAIVTEFFGYRSERYFHAVILGRNKNIDIPFTEIGKTVFLTREEAEAAMAQKGGEG